ncbi:MAG TPA: peptide chain release factor N(5)-glutamine methyltransferase [Candidatus Binataceae bacterium]|nr:peptide chain release factor N(5)-glutamine methyltransferase [Candidatus Binataceae bacterium]
MRTGAEARNSTARIQEIVQRAARTLAAAGVDTARLDAEVLLAEAAGAGRAQVLAGAIEPTEEILARFSRWLLRREAREPLAYIIGHKEFYSLDFEVNPAVLIPRPETETLVAAALEFIGARDVRVLDIGTGSGAIAIAIAAGSPRARVVATDVSEPALEVARRNAARLGVAQRVEVRLADLFEVLDGGPPLGRFDLIVSNPPYVDDAAMAALAPEIRDHEPRRALAGGPDGLAVYRRIAARVSSHMTREARLMVEIGARQAAAVAALFAAAGLRDAGVIDDLAGIPRVAVMRL